MPLQNILHTCQIQKHHLRHLCRRGHGNIINISSVAGLQPMKGFAVYCAAKYGG